MDLDSIDKFCFGVFKKIVIIGEIIKGIIIFKFGLNISLEAIFDI